MAFNLTTTEPALIPSAVVIEADDAAVLDTDSTFGENVSVANSTALLNSGITKYRSENGRTYHGFRDGAYLLPNDEQEQDRLDMQHHVFCLLSNGRLCLAPVNEPARVLDVGTGTGIWAIDFADQNPSSHVIGCDLSPIQPGFVPPNCQFEVDDISSPWLHKPFNFIHIRGLSGSLLDYRGMLASAYDNLAPGGWCEVAEFTIWAKEQREDTPANENQIYGVDVQSAPFLQQWQSGLHEAANKIGRRLDASVYVKGWFEDLGFKNVVQTITKLPIMPWPRDRFLKEVGL